MERTLGDSHNFGRRVTALGDRIVKPRTVVWERLILSADSPLRCLLRDAADKDGLGADAFEFLPSLQISPSPEGPGGEVERVDLSPLPALSADDKRALATLTGRFIALASFLGIGDLHWENLVLGKDARGRTVLAPLDVELILDDMELPTETKLLPEADPEYADVCRHAAGIRRVLPYLGKPISPGDLVAMAAAYRGALAFLERHAGEIASVFSELPNLSETPIRVCLRGTGDYVQALALTGSSHEESLWPPLLEEEAIQLARGDIPYFFRLYGKQGIHYYTDPDLRTWGTLPTEGDVPQLASLLKISRAFRSSSRRRLREEGLFTLLGAFDHRSYTGTFASDDVEVTFRGRTLILKLGDEELESRRDMSDFVGSVYLPCLCGEVLTPFVPEKTRCEPRAPVQKGRVQKGERRSNVRRS
ncbi:MAG: hypothetical protein U0441_15875 [Polyangiaceae bacterium]